MSIELSQLTKYLEECLEPGRFSDYCPNGLQVEGCGEVTRLVTGVTACQELLDAAVSRDAQAILVHHGYFWSGEAQQIVGIKRRRLHTLLTNDISLLAYHLPLDAHPEFGNNVRFGELMGIDSASHRPLQPHVPASVGNIARLEQPLTAGALVQRLAAVTEREPLHIGDKAALVQNIAWCTGAAQSYIEKAVAAGADLFVTGEVSEQTVHIAREEGIQFIAAGHHATERYGVQALGDHLAERFGLEHLYVDIDNPV